MMKEEMGSEFGAVIIDDVGQCQAGSHRVPVTASAQTLHGDCEQHVAAECGSLCCDE